MHLMTFTIDETDALILELLQKDGRMMFKDIASRVGVSLPTARKRIERLTEFGIIKRFGILVDTGKVLGRLRALLLIRAEPSSVDDITRRLSKMNEFREVYLCAGSYNIIAKVETRDSESLGRLTTASLKDVKGITEISSIIITRVEKEEYGGVIDSQSIVQFKCRFCNAPILGKPHVETINGVRSYFHGPECLEAYRQKKERGPAR